MTWSGEAMSITRYVDDKLILPACAKLEHDQSTECPSLSRVICSPWVLYCLSMGSFYMVAIRLCVFHWDNTSFGRHSLNQYVVAAPVEQVWVKQLM